jgi:virulence-associated protein VapD
LGKYDKLLRRILGGKSDASVPFSDLRQVLIRLGFDERIKGDHHIYTKQGIEEILNLQPKGSMANQVKQVRNVIVRYKLGPEDVE